MVAGPFLPLPPGLFSITSGWPRCCCAISPSLRKWMSVPPPARPGADQRDRLVPGKVCAARASAEQQPAASPESVLIPSPPPLGDYSRGPRRIGLVRFQPQRPRRRRGRHRHHGPRHRAGPGAMRCAHPGVRCPARCSAKAKESIGQSLGKLAEKGRLAAAEVEKPLARIEIVESLEGSGARHLVVEAIVEELAAKRQLFSALEKVVKQRLHPRVEHLVALGDRDGRGVPAAGARRGLSLLQPGAGDEDRRSGGRRR